MCMALGGQPLAALPRGAATTLRAQPLAAPQPGPDYRSSAKGTPLPLDGGGADRGR